MGLQVAVLGAPEVTRDGVTVTFDTRKATALLAYLVVEGRPVRREALAALLWPDAPRERAGAALRRTLSVLRAGVGEEHLDVGRDVVALRADTSSDLGTAAGLLASCGDHGHAVDAPCPACVDPLRRAAAIHRGPFLEGFTLRDSDRFDDWRFFTSEELTRTLADALERLCGALVAAGLLSEAIGPARRWLALDPLQEAAHTLLVQLYDWTGSRNGALRQYRECVRLLDVELGVAPLEETTEVYRAVCERRLTPPTATSPAAATAPPARATRTPPDPPVRPPLVAFVGRAAERDALVAAVTAAGPDGHLVVVEGEAGIGKTRLVLEALADVRLAGRRTVVARSHEGEAGLAFALVTDLLRGALDDGLAARLPGHVRTEVRRLVPELGDGREPPPLDSPGAQGRFAAAVADAVTAAAAGPVPGVVVLEDLQWADGASIDMLAYLARRLRGRPLALVATWRTEQVSRGHRLRQVLATARRDGDGTALAPGRLDVAAIAAVVGGDTARATRIHAATEGIPLLVVECLTAADPDASSPRPPTDPGDGDVPAALPGGARDLLAARVDGVSATGAQVLAAAAVVGRDLQPGVLRAVSGRSDEEVAGALDELVGAGILVEIAGASPGYDFAHGQLRAIAYGQAGLARRRLLHRRTAEVLGARDRRRAVGVPGRSSGAAEIAFHYGLAGDEDAAADWEVLAGDRARALLALDEATAHYERALALGHPDPVTILVAVGDLRTMAGRYGDARSAYETAAARAAPDEVAPVERRLGEVHARLGDWGLADAHFEAALAAPGSLDLRARLLADRALVAHRGGDSEGARTAAEAALTAAEEAADDGARVQALNVLGLLDAAGGAPERAERRLSTSLVLARRLDDPAAEIAAANNLARLLRARGATERALDLSNTALARFASAGDRHREAALHSNVADLLRDLGRDEEARTHVRAAVAILAEVGEPGVLAPEVWKLEEW